MIEASDIMQEAAVEETQLSQPELMKLVGSRFIIGIPTLLLILFLPAGTFAYWEAWIFLAILLIPTFVGMIYLSRYAPQLLVRRMKVREKEVEQRTIIGLSFIPSLLTFILPGLDKRLGWSNVPIAIIILGEILVVFGFTLFLLVLKENQFASRVIEVEKGQRVIQSGPYRFVRHPMYLGAIVIYLGSPAALGSYWAMIPAVFILPVLVARILNEESILTRELEGYSEYKQKTKYRLIPGIW